MCTHGFYKNNIPVGEYKQWNKDGKLIKQKIYMSE
jgi:antitoxin component YwqK of YwqJK toxin-antitoxin module